MAEAIDDDDDAIKADKIVLVPFLLLLMLDVLELASKLLGSQPLERDKSR